MKDFTLVELDEFITFLFERTKDRDERKSSIEAATRCFYEYEPVINKGLTEKIACSIIIGRLIAKHGNRIFVGQHDLVLKAAKEATLMKSELDLTPAEQNEVVRWANELLAELSSMEIVHDPRAL